MQNVTSIEQMKQQAQGSLVSLPPFAEGEELVVRLKRPSMLALMRAKKIPNSLVTAANTMFQKGPGAFNTADENMMNEIFEIMDVICEASLVEPTYKQIKEAGIELTDDQLMFIFGYTQNGVKQLESFR